MRVRIVTWNVHSCVGTDGRYEPGRIADTLRSLDADVIALQEVDWRKPEIDGLDQFDFLTRELGMAAVEGPNLEDHHGRYGNGLLTRLPVKSVQRADLAQPGREPRGLIDARLDAGGRPLRVFTTHLGLSRGERRRQWGMIRDHLDRTRPSPGEAVVLAGDFNEWLTRSLVRSNRLGHWFDGEEAPKTYPSRAPLVRLDRVLLGKNVRAETVLNSAGSRVASDHRPVSVDLRLDDGAAARQDP